MTVHQLWLKRTIELIIYFSNTIIQHQQWTRHNQQYCKGWEGGREGGRGEAFISGIMCEVVEWIHTAYENVNDLLL